jgi:hypothetical protein
MALIIPETEFGQAGEIANDASTTLSTATLPSPRWLSDAGNGAILGDRKVDPESCEKTSKVSQPLCKGKGGTGTLPGTAGGGAGLPERGCE